MRGYPSRQRKVRPADWPTADDFCDEVRTMIHRKGTEAWRGACTPSIFGHRIEHPKVGAILAFTVIQGFSVATDPPIQQG
jgi:hypothetical protein